MNIIAQEGEQGAIQSHLCLGSNSAEDTIVEVHAMGFAVDNHNDPPPENISTTSATTPTGTTEPSLFQGHHQKWKSDLFVHPRIQNGGSKKGSSLPTLDKPTALSILEILVWSQAAQDY